MFLVRQILSQLPTDELFDLYLATHLLCRRFDKLFYALLIVFDVGLLGQAIRLIELL